MDLIVTPELVYFDRFNISNDFNIVTGLSLDYDVSIGSEFTVSKNGTDFTLTLNNPADTSSLNRTGSISTLYDIVTFDVSYYNSPGGIYWAFENNLNNTYSGGFNTYNLEFTQSRYQSSYTFYLFESRHPGKFCTKINNNISNLYNASALQADSSAGWFECDSLNNFFNAKTPGSFSSWYRTNERVYTNNNGYSIYYGQTIISFIGTDGGLGGGLGAGLVAFLLDGSLCVQRSGTDFTSSGFRYIGTSNKADNNWHNIIYTFDGVTSRIYDDGVKVYETTNNDSLNTYKFFIGTYFGESIDPSEGYAGLAFNPWYGYLDDTQIWSYGLSESDVSIYYNLNK
jgi:hypothetical protein